MSHIKMLGKEEISKIKDKDFNVYDNYIKAYRECMPNLNDVQINEKISCNYHLLNKDFENEPKFFLSFSLDSILENGILVISAIYVYEKYRNYGYAKELIENIKTFAKNGYLIQAAVYENKFLELKEFYLKLGFKTTCSLSEPDNVGVRYVDFFWCNDEIELKFVGTETIVKKIKKH